MKNSPTLQHVFELANKTFGTIPGVIREAAQRSPHAAYLLIIGTSVMENASFSLLEMNAIELKISSLNNCESCVRGHSFLLKKEGATPDLIQSILSNNSTKNERIDTLIKATELIYFAGGGQFPGHALDFLNENVSEREVVDIISLIAVKTIPNYINNYLASIRSYRQAV